MKWGSCLILFTVVIAPALGLQNLTFFGHYVVFKPATNFIKFDLLEELDVLLLERRVDTSSATSSYRIQLTYNFFDNETNSLNYTFYKKGKKMLSGHYEFWNKTEKDNMALRWISSERRNAIEVLTYVDGNHNTVFSWWDKTKNKSSPKIKYVGLAVAPNTTETSSIEHRHFHWKIREEEDTDIELRRAFKLIDIKLLAANESTPIYEIFVTQEDDNNYWMFVKKGHEKATRIRTSQLENNIQVSWDSHNRLLAVGHESTPVPLLLWQDPSSGESDFSRIKNVFIRYSKTNDEHMFPVTSETFKTIPQLFPGYFSSSPTSMEKNNAKAEPAINIPEMEIPFSINDLIAQSTEDI